MEEGIVYVLSNEAMPGLVKIGLTGRKDLEDRLNELYNTSVPVPFTCEYACRVNDCLAVEKALHQAFSTDRVNQNREFFRTSVDRIIPLLKIMQIEEITTKVSEDINRNISVVDIQAANNIKKRRPILNFQEMKIPVGAELVMINENQEYKVTVNGDRTVLYDGNEYHLTPLTRELLELEYNVNPCSYWFFNGRPLRDIYNETYSEETE